MLINIDAEQYELHSMNLDGNCPPLTILHAEELLLFTHIRHYKYTSIQVYHVHHVRCLNVLIGRVVV